MLGDFNLNPTLALDQAHPLHNEKRVILKILRKIVWSTMFSEICNNWQVMDGMNIDMFTDMFDWISLL